MTLKAHTPLQFFLLSSLALLSACTDLGGPAAPGADLVAGSWRLDRTLSGHDQRASFPPPDVVRIDTYSPQGGYSRTENGQLLITAHYYVTEQSTACLLRLAIDWVAGGLMLLTREPKFRIEAERDTLRLLSSDVYDSFPEVQVFVRVR
jgi:hypothetical protein